jgi:hypothetical protein
VWPSADPKIKVSTWGKPLNSKKKRVQRSVCSVTQSEYSSFKIWVNSPPRESLSPQADVPALTQVHTFADQFHTGLIKVLDATISRNLEEVYGWQMGRSKKCSIVQY